MKKILLVIAIGLAVISCDKSTEVKEQKTAYVDTAKLLEESIEAKDIEAKYKTKGQEMGKELEMEIARFKSEAGSFQKNAQANGQAWAQQKGAELQQREQQLSYAQNALLQQLRQESGVEMDTLVKGMKKFIQSYGKEKGYAFIYDGSAILHADEKADITKDIIKLVNDKYKATGKKTETAPAIKPEKAK